MKLDLCLTSYREINSNGLKTRPETVKLSEENMGRELYVDDLGNDFMDLTPSAEATKAIIDNWGYIKVKCFCTVKKIFSRGGNPLHRRKYL